MPTISKIRSGLGSLARNPREFLRFRKGNVELWANLIVITWRLPSCSGKASASP